MKNDELVIKLRSRIEEFAIGYEYLSEHGWKRGKDAYCHAARCFRSLLEDIDKTTEKETQE